mmetsp:Transcript_30815/g.50973  ORF Transcript_30815/g.50973 Transcript_30815/m.50973 type:complete len:483 (-) Transcript_30815:56-1504(-)
MAHYSAAQRPITLLADLAPPLQEKSLLTKIGSGQTCEEEAAHPDWQSLMCNWLHSALANIGCACRCFLKCSFCRRRHSRAHTRLDYVDELQVTCNGLETPQEHIEMVAMPSSEHVDMVAIPSSQETEVNAGAAEPKRGQPDTQQLQTIWSRLLAAQEPIDAQVAWPPLDKLRSSVFESENYSKLLQCRDDWRSSCPKMLCAVGAVALARLEWVCSSGYTGLFAEDSEGLLRLSSALEPPALASSLPAPLRVALRFLPGPLGRARLFPCAAFKVPRKDMPSANLLFMGRKHGQADASFVSADSSLATLIDEDLGAASQLLQAILDTFRRHTKFPCQTGLSDFAHAAHNTQRFPWALVLTPTEHVQTLAQQGQHDLSATHSSFLSQLLSIPPGTPLYKVHTVDSPDAALRPDGIVFAGRLVTSSEFIRSTADAVLSFWHQKKEDDYELCPEWLKQLKPEHRSCGPEHFEKMIKTARTRNSVELA